MSNSYKWQPSWQGKVFTQKCGTVGNEATLVKGHSFLLTKLMVIPVSENIRTSIEASKNSILSALRNLFRMCGAGISNVICGPGGGGYVHNYKAHTKELYSAREVDT